MKSRRNVLKLKVWKIEFYFMHSNFLTMIIKHFLFFQRYNFNIPFYTHVIDILHQLFFHYNIRT